MKREVAIGLLLITVALTGCIADTGERIEQQATTDESDAESDDQASQEADEASGQAATNDEAGDEAGDEGDVVEDAQENVTDAVPEDPLAVLNVTDSGTLKIDVPVDVVLIGFPQATAQALDDRLADRTTEHVTNSKLSLVPEGPDDSFGNTFNTLDTHVVPKAIYNVHGLDSSVTTGLLDTLEKHRVPGTEDPIYDARGVEAWLADTLRDQGIPLDEGTPALVLLHTGSTGDHAYRNAYENGYLQPVRMFGGEEPLIALDVSARHDPSVVRTYDCDAVPGGEQCRSGGDAYDWPLEAAGNGTVDALETAVHEATDYRLLQGPLYPPTTRACHAITLILGVEATAVDTAAPWTPTAQEMFDVDRLTESFKELTGGDQVFVDAKVLSLPADDPALWGVANGETIATTSGEAARHWISENWQDYWVAHEGCEAYVSFHLFGDFTQATASWGVGMYEENGHRISFSVTAADHRFFSTYGGPEEDRINSSSDSRDRFDWVNELFAHETGHILSIRHPHDVQTTDGSDGDSSWSSGLTTMSYQTGDRTVRFGAIDQANYQRNRAGQLIHQVVTDDLAQGATYDQALLDLAGYDWATANQKLVDLLAAGQADQAGDGG